MSRGVRFTYPRLGALRWLLESGAALEPELRDPLLVQLFNTPKAVLMGIVNGVILNIVGLLLHHDLIFAVFLAIDLVLSALRYRIASKACEAADHGAPTPTDAYLVTGILWCCLQGSMGCAAMLSRMPALQVLGSAAVLGLVGPICARNYPAPRLAMLLVSLSDLPLVAGGALSGNHWLLVLVAQTPLLLIGTLAVILHFHKLAIGTLQAKHESDRHARHDPLTGLLNRTGFSEVMERRDGPLADGFALFYLDLDGFKQINDTLGHGAGDRLLQEVGRRLDSSTRSTDIVVRQGGDEFIIAAPGMGATEAAEFAGMVIRRITDHDYLLEGKPAHVGISIGFACSPEDGTGLDELQRKADAALYDSKRAGRGTHRRFRESAAPRESRRLQRPSLA